MYPGYAKPFLSLSLNQRQQLQHAIRKLGQQASAQLLIPGLRREGAEGAEGAVGEESNSSFTAHFLTLT